MGEKYNMFTAEINSREEEMNDGSENNALCKQQGAIMTAVIMAGGKGSRLSAVTKNEIPKPMAEVAGKPILQWQVERLRQNGITEIIMVVGHLGQVIEDFFGDGGAFSVSIRYYRETEPLGTAGALHHLQDMLAGQDYFLLVYGDVVFDIDIPRMERFHREKEAGATLFVHPNSHPYDSDLVELDGVGRVLRFNMKTNQRNHWYRNCVNAGFYILSTEVCDMVAPSGKTDLEKDILQRWAAQRSDLYGYHSPEYIKDVGTPERIAVAEQEMLRGTVAARNLKNRQKCIFLDRDGTLNKWEGFVSSPQQLKLEESAAEAVRLINQSGYLAIVVTNQPVVARGLCSVEDVEEIHRKMETLLGQKSAYLDDILFCPHHPDKGYPEENPAYKINCNCRKPKTGMIDACIEKYNINPAASWMVGDTTVDMQTGANAGLKTALLRTGEGGRDGKYPVSPTLQCEDVLEAVQTILSLPL